MEVQALVELWKRARTRGEDVYLATVVHVQGSSYRKPGARMLVTSGGQRAGTISGGCLEAEVTRKIAWLTHDGPSLQTYQSSFDDETDQVRFGLGCGGTIWVLMESGEAVDAVMCAFELALDQRKSLVSVTSLAGDQSLRTVVLSEEEISKREANSSFSLRAQLMNQALSDRCPVASATLVDSVFPEYICLPILPPPRLYVFGAGDDAQPIVRFAVQLGWDVIVADGRRQLLRKDRFPDARQLRLLTYSTPVSSGQAVRELISDPEVTQDDYAVILTHSYEQDQALLKILLLQPLQYLGILGPLHRTRRLLDSISHEIGLSPEDCLARLHAPVGLDIGSGDPAVIALSIVAEIQARIAGVHVRVEWQSSAGITGVHPRYPLSKIPAQLPGDDLTMIR